jgi:hypothetical protein
MSFIHLINENFRNPKVIEDVKPSLSEVDTKLYECVEHLKQIKIKEKQIKENWVSVVQDKDLTSQLSTLKEQFEKALKDLKLEQDDVKSTYNHYKEIKSKILTENKEVVKDSVKGISESIKHTLNEADEENSNLNDETNKNKSSDNIEKIVDKLKDADYEDFVKILNGDGKSQAFIAFLQKHYKLGDDTIATIKKANPSLATTNCSQLIPTQKNISLSKSLGLIENNPQWAKSIIENPVKAFKTPTVTYADKYIIDGHHRWSKVYALDGGDTKIAVLNFPAIEGVTWEDMLKAVQLAIVATDPKAKLVNNVPDDNMLQLSAGAIKDFVLNHMSDDVSNILKINGRGDTKEEQAIKIASNVAMMAETSSPVSGAPNRAYMPQMDDSGNAKSKLQTGVIDMTESLLENTSKSIKPLNEAEITLDDEDMFDPKSFSLSGLVNKKVQQERDAEAAALKAQQNLEAAQKVQKAIKLARGEDDELETLTQELVPPSGKCDTLAGEIIRCIQRLLYRDFNDGDKFLYGYGLETCAPAAAFLHSHGYDGPIESIMEEIGRFSFDYSGADDIYTRMLQELADKIVQDIFMGKFQEKNDADMWDADEKWIIEQQPVEDMYIDYSDKILAHYNKGNVSASDIANWVEDMGNWDGTFKDIEVSASYSDVHIDNLNYDAFTELNNMVEDGSFWRAYEDELENEYGDPEEDEDEYDDDEEFDDDFDNEIIEEDLAGVYINDDFDLDLDSPEIEEEDKEKDFAPVSKLVEKLGL